MSIFISHTMNKVLPHFVLPIHTTLRVASAVASEYRPQSEEPLCLVTRRQFTFSCSKPFSDRRNDKICSECSGSFEYIES